MINMIFADQASQERPLWVFNLIVIQVHVGTAEFGRILTCDRKFASEFTFARTNPPKSNHSYMSFWFLTIIRRGY
jgi:hypothetical protein